MILFNTVVFGIPYEVQNIEYLVSLQQCFSPVEGPGAGWGSIDYTLVEDFHLPAGRACPR